MNFAKKLAAVAIFASSLILTGCGQAQIGSVDVDKIMADAPRVKTLLTEAEGKIKETEEYKSYLQKNPELAVTARDFGTKIPYIYAFGLDTKYKNVESFIMIEKFMPFISPNSEKE